jgi:hypothetical protein
MKRTSAPVYIRNEAQIRALMVPWKVQEIRPLATWLGVEDLVQESDRVESAAEMYGVMLAREEQPHE